jgi:hypothetical protein
MNLLGTSHGCWQPLIAITRIYLKQYCKKKDSTTCDLRAQVFRRIAIEGQK